MRVHLQQQKKHVKKQNQGECRGATEGGREGGGEGGVTDIRKQTNQKSNLGRCRQRRLPLIGWSAVPSQSTPETTQTSFTQHESIKKATIHTKSFDLFYSTNCYPPGEW